LYDIGEGVNGFLPVRTVKINEALGFPRVNDCATDCLLYSILLL
jgi:hypothetical protein